MHLQAFLSVPWDWKEIASVSTLEFWLLLCCELISWGMLQHETIGSSITSNHPINQHSAGVHTVADVAVDSGLLGVTHLS